MSTLQILLPQAHLVSVDGRDVEIKPVCLRDFEGFATAAGELIAAMADPSNGAVMKFAASHKKVRSVLSCSTNLSAWRLWRLPASTAVELMVHVIRVNASFFDQALIDLASVLNGKTPSSS